MIYVKFDIITQPHDPFIHGVVKPSHWKSSKNSYHFKYKLVFLCKIFIVDFYSNIQTRKTPTMRHCYNQEDERYERICIFPFSEEALGIERLRFINL